MNGKEVLSWLTTLSWFAAEGLTVHWGILSRVKTLGGWRAAAMTSLFFVAILLTAVNSMLVFIPPDQRGVVISALPGDQGVKPEALDPGLQWIVPFFQSVEFYPISRQTYTMSGATGEGQVTGDDSIKARTKDGQQVFVDASLIYAIDPAQVVDVHISWQNRYQDELLRPNARGIIRDVVSQHRLSELLPDTQPELEREVAQMLGQKLDENGLILIGLRLRVQSTEEHAALLQQPRAAEAEKETDLLTNWQTFVRQTQGGLQTIACLAFPVCILLALFARGRRRRSDISSVSTDYQRGLTHLQRGERAEAIEAFTTVYRTATDPALTQQALEQLEALGAVKKF